MAYPEIPDYTKLARPIALYSQLKHEYGAAGILPLLAQAQQALELALEELKALPADPIGGDSSVPDRGGRVRGNRKHRWAHTSCYPLRHRQFRPGLCRRARAQDVAV